MKKSEQAKASKREDGVDLISNMPDAILLLILSRLSSTEETIRTSILSHRWRYLWTAIPSVDLQVGSDQKSKRSEFKEFVYWALACKTVDLESIRLCLNGHYSLSTIWRWVRMAVSKKVKQIDLSFYTDDINETIELPRYLVSYASLEVLSLGFMYNCLRLPSGMGFPALRALGLTTVAFVEDGEELKDFLKSCPLLEDLSLIGCSIEEIVCISCPKLKRLSIVNWEDVGPYGIKLSCPDLEDLDLGGHLMDGNPEPVAFLGNPNFKLLWAHFHFYCESIDAGCDVGLSNLKTTVLRTTMEAFTVDELIRILKYCPKVENLTLIIRKDVDEEYKWLDEAETRRIWTTDVKTIEFFEFNGKKPKLDIEWCENELKMFFTFFWGRGRPSN